MEDREPAKEWHLFSAMAVTCAIVFICVQYFTGTPQIIGVALGPVVGTYFFSSANWKNQPSTLHVWMIWISVVAIIGPAILVKLKLLPKKWLLTSE